MNPYRTSSRWLLASVLLLACASAPVAQAAPASTTAAPARPVAADELRSYDAPQFGITYTLRCDERFDFDVTLVTKLTPRYAASPAAATFVAPALALTSYAVAPGRVSAGTDDPSAPRTQVNRARYLKRANTYSYFQRGKVWRFFHERR